MNVMVLFKGKKNTHSHPKARGRVKKYEKGRDRSATKEMVNMTRGKSKGKANNKGQSKGKASRSQQKKLSDHCRKSKQITAEKVE